MANIKTNAMRNLEANKIEYTVYTYESDGDFDGCHVAQKIGKEPHQVFKTLVTVSLSKKYYVFVIPVAEHLDLKKAAKAVGEKSIEMIRQDELLPLTGYIHGGCSPVGMKKLFKTVVDAEAETLETFVVSSGKIGCFMELSPKDLQKLIGSEFVSVLA